MVSEPVSATAIADEIDPRLLDCWQVNVAIALRARGIGDLRSLLGAQWWFDTPHGASGPVLDFEDPTERIRRHAGVTVETHRLAPGELVRRCGYTIDLGGVCLVISDAYVMPWVPYAGHKHVEHSFVVRAARSDRGTLTFADGYHNRTERGDAVPIHGEIDAATLAAIESAAGARLVTFHGGGVPVPVDRGALLRENIARLGSWHPTERYPPYAEKSCADGVDLPTFESFCEACWAIERRRGLYARWLDDLCAERSALLPPDFAARFRSSVVTAWEGVNKFTYLSLRRMRGGRPPNPALVNLVRAAAEAEATLRSELLDGHSNA